MEELSATHRHNSKIQNALVSKKGRYWAEKLFSKHNWTCLITYYYYVYKSSVNRWLQEFPACRVTRWCNTDHVTTTLRVQKINLPKLQKICSQLSPGLHHYSVIKHFDSTVQILNALFVLLLASLISTFSQTQKIFVLPSLCELM